MGCLKKTAWTAAILTIFAQHLASSPALAQGPDFSIGVAFNINEDRPGHYSFNLSPSGGVTFKNGEESVSVTPQMIFVFDEHKLIRVQASVSNVVKAMSFNMEVKPVIITDGSSKIWVLDPMSLVPKVEGVDVGSIPSTVKDVRNAIAEMGEKKLDPNDPVLKLKTEGPIPGVAKSGGDVKKPCPPADTAPIQIASLYLNPDFYFADEPLLRAMAKGEEPRLPNSTAAVAAPTADPYSPTPPPSALSMRFDKTPANP